MKQIISSLSIGPDESSIQVGIVKYSDDARVVAYLNEFNQEELYLALDLLENTGGTTNTTGAIRLTRTAIFNQSHGDRPCKLIEFMSWTSFECHSSLVARNVAILISDGQTTVDGETLEIEADLLKDNGARVIAVGVTDWVLMTELIKIASSPGQVFRLTDYLNLRYILNPIMSMACVEDGKRQS
jgi:hypothetical protein